MANDRRIRRQPLPIGVALINSDGERLYYGACLGHAVDWYAQHHLPAESPEAEQFVAEDPVTWTDVIVHMHVAGMELHELTHLPEVSVKQADLAYAVARFGSVHAMDFEKRVIPDEMLELKSYRLDIVNPLVGEHGGR